MPPKQGVPQCWKVVGGADKGGILARSGQELKSAELPERLATGAVVKELQLVGDRLEFKKLRKKDAGPATGWVSVKLPGKELLTKCEAPEPPDFNSWIPKEEPEENEAPPETDGWTSPLGFERIPNFRDVADSHPEGGLMVGVDGRALRRGRLFRSGHWVCATEKDIRKLKEEIGIKTYIDLRVGQSMEAVDAPVYDDYPPSTAKRHKGLPEKEPGERRRVWCPFTKDLAMRAATPDEMAGTVSELDRRDMNRWYNAWANKMMLQSQLQLTVAQSLSNVNKWILFINEDEVLKAMKTLVDERNYPLLFGCVAGKDRTGILSCLILGALGVSEELIMADYLRTNRAAAHINACGQVGTFNWFKEIFDTEPKKFHAMAKTGRVTPLEFLPAPEGSPSPFLRGNKAIQAFCSTFGFDEPPLPQEDTPADADMASNQENLRQARVYRRTMEYTLKLLREEGGTVAYLDSIGFGAEDVAKLRELLLE